MEHNGEGFEIPDILYHGTTNNEEILRSIAIEGLNPFGRHKFVFLTESFDKAENEGKRHGGEAFVIQIDTNKMKEDGVEILFNTRGVWLTRHVDPKYFMNLELIEDGES